MWLDLEEFLPSLRKPLAKKERELSPPEELRSRQTGDDGL